MLITKKAASFGWEAASRIGEINSTSSSRVQGRAASRLNSVVESATYSIGLIRSGFLKTKLLVAFGIRCTAISTSRFWEMRTGGSMSLVSHRIESGRSINVYKIVGVCLMMLSAAVSIAAISIVVSTIGVAS
jgi:hypothetical protein